MVCGSKSKRNLLLNSFAFTSLCHWLFCLNWYSYSWPEHPSWWIRSPIAKATARTFVHPALGASQWKIYYRRMRGQLSTTCSNVLKQSNRELLVAINHNQLRTMASEMVDQIDFLHPPPLSAVPHERLVHSINQCNLSRNRTCHRSMLGNHLAYAATRGICYEIAFPLV